MATEHKFNQTDHQAVEVFNLMTQVHQFEIITIGLKILMGFIGTLTLGIGGVGLMNIMLVSVTQRTREIGVQKALGAPRRYILMQFLAEALTITFLGGVLGVILAYVVALSRPAHLV
jgi:putative ABC transport system permease protein